VESNPGRTELAPTPHFYRSWPLALRQHAIKKYRNKANKTSRHKEASQQNNMIGSKQTEKLQVSKPTSRNVSMSTRHKVIKPATHL
jgi:hypothetical protein